jgi:hypothetical protein
MRNHRRAQEQKLADDARLLRAWKRWHREERTAVLAGPHGPALAELFRMLDNIEHVRPSQLVGLVQSIAWSTIDYPTRLAVLHETNSAVSKQRERLGLAPFDDGLPGDPPNVFCLIRTAILFAELPAARGGHVGADADLQPATPLSMEQSYE